MKLKNILMLLSLTVFVWNANARPSPAHIGDDFAPYLVWDATSNSLQPLVDNGIGIGWYLDIPATDHVAPVDYRKLQNDQAYGQSLYAENSPYLNYNIRNLVYAKSGESGISLSDVPLAKMTDPQGSGKIIDDTYSVCFNGAGINSNHRSCSIDFDTASGFSVVQIQDRFDAGNIQAIKIDKDRGAIAWGDLLSATNQVFGKTLENRFGKDGTTPDLNYQRDAAKLSYEFTLKAIKPTADADQALVLGTGYAEVPKDLNPNSFTTTIAGSVKLVYDEHQGITLGTVPQAAPAQRPIK